MGPPPVGVVRVLHDGGQLVLRKACPRLVDQSFDREVAQLRAAARPRDLLLALDQAQPGQLGLDVDQLGLRARSPEGQPPRMGHGTSDADPRRREPAEGELGTGGFGHVVATPADVLDGRKRSGGRHVVGVVHPQDRVTPGREQEHALEGDRVVGQVLDLAMRRPVAI